jgi:hypothetical protein
MQALPAVLIVAACFYHGDIIEQIRSLDLIGLGFRFAIALVAGAAVFTFGTFGSYLFSLVFAVRTIVKQRVTCDGPNHESTIPASDDAPSMATDVP